MSVVSSGHACLPDTYSKTYMKLRTINATTAKTYTHVELIDAYENLFSQSSSASAPLSVGLPLSLFIHPFACLSVRSSNQSVSPQPDTRGLLQRA